MPNLVAQDNIVFVIDSLVYKSRPFHYANLVAEDVVDLWMSIKYPCSSPMSKSASLFPIHHYIRLDRGTSSSFALPCVETVTVKSLTCTPQP